MNETKSAAGKSGAAWVWGGGIIAVAVAVGSYLFVNQNAQPTSDELAALVPEIAPVDQQALEPQADEEASQGDASEAAPAVEDIDAVEEDKAETPEPVAPSIDEVRLAADGVAVVAGRAEPGSTVDVVVDGDVVASAQADASGAFAAIGVVDADEEARVLSLQSGEGDELVRSDDEVILAPVTAPAPDVSAESEASTQELETVANEDDAAPETGSISDTETEKALVDAQTADEPDPVAPMLETADEAVEDRLENTGEEIASAPVVEAPVTDTASLQDSETEDASVPSAGPSTENEGSEAVADAGSAATPDTEAETANSAASSQVALLKSDEEGVTLLQTTPKPPARVQLDTIGYSESGAVQLAGRASVEAAEVRIYLNNRSVASFDVDLDGAWRGEVLDVAAGVYTLRVDAVDAQGRVTSRLETPFKREAPEVLAEASAEADGPATAVTVQQGDTLWAIARDRYGEGLLYVQVFEANRASIRDPDLIYPGQIFELPSE